MVKNYGIHDEWKDLNKVNDIDIKSIDGVIDSIKVNGEEAGGVGNLFTIKTVVIDYNTQEPITDPNLYVSAKPAFRIPFMDGDPEPYIFTMYDNGTIDLYYQNSDEPFTVMDTITVKAKYPFFLSSVEVLIGETVKTIDDGTYNNTPVNPAESFQIEESGTLKLFVL